MRKHKSVVAILLAVMMIFTFMPTMAFASIPSDVQTNDYAFSDDLSQIVKSDGTTVVVGTVKEWNPAHASVVVKANTSQVGDLDPVVKAMKFEYVDLNNSTFVVNDTNDLAASYNSSLGIDVSNAVNRITALKVKKPADAVKVNTTDPETVIVDLDNLMYAVNYNTANAWNCVVNLNGKTDTITPKTEDQSVEVTLKQTWTKSNNHRVTGAPAAATTKVNATSADYNNAKFYIDKDKTPFNSGTKTVEYDGAEHSVVMDELKGYTVKYTVFNSATGNWDKVDTVTVKEPGDKNAKTVEANIYDSKDKIVKKYTFTVEVETTAYAQVGFDKDGDLGEYTYRVEPGTLFDPADFLTVNAISYRSGSGWWSQTHNPTDADKAAVEANKAEILAAFKDYYEIEQKSTKADPNTVTLTIKAKKLSSDEAKALETKYKDLFNRFYELDANTTQTGTVKFQKNPAVNDKTDDITFSGVTTKSFKAKKKTKKLAKDKSFQVAAVADSGNVVTFTATSSNKKVSIDAQGKVTVKKGLKKGAKVKLVVKAKTAAGNGYKAASAEKTYTIKIK